MNKSCAGGTSLIMRKEESIKHNFPMALVLRLDWFSEFETFSHNSHVYITALRGRAVIQVLECRGEGYCREDTSIVLGTLKTEVRQIQTCSALYDSNNIMSTWSPSSQIRSGMASNYFHCIIPHGLTCDPHQRPALPAVHKEARNKTCTWWR